jgi:hypothetical protein
VRRVRNEVVLPIAQFLGRAWSGKSSLVVELDKDVTVPCATEYATVKKPVIVMPPPSRYPATELVTAYRLWRASLWHEAMHHYFGLPKVGEQSRPLIGPVGFYVWNCVEDYRIEHKGVKEWKGMEKELAFRKAFYFRLAKKPDDILMEFTQLLLLEAVKDKIPDPKVVEAVEYVKKAVEQGVDSLVVAIRVCRILGVSPDGTYDFQLPDVVVFPVMHPQKNPMKKLPKTAIKSAVKEWLEAKRSQSTPLEEGEGEEGEENESEESEGEGQEGRKMGRKEGGKAGKGRRKAGKGEDSKNEDESEDLDELVEEIARAPEDVQKEIEEMKSLDQKIEIMRKGASAEVAEGVYLPSLLYRDESPYYDRELIAHLVAQLRKIRRGWKEVHSDSGELDIESYVSRHSKPFIDEEKLKTGGIKVIILLDHSQSIEYFEHNYKKACIALCEGLKAAGIPFAVYAFSLPSQAKETVLWLVKSFEETWSRTNAKRLVQIKADGGTPLHKMYRKLRPLVMKHKGKLYFITLTDGAPDSAALTEEEIADLKKYCKMIAIAIGEDMDEAVRLARNLGRLGYDRYVALDDVRKLPEKVLKLLGE